MSILLKTITHMLNIKRRVALVGLNIFASIFFLGCSFGDGIFIVGADVRTIFGDVYKGYVLSGTVTVYNKLGDILGTTPFIDASEYTIHVPAYSGSVKAVLDIESYIDETTGKRVNLNNVRFVALGVVDSFNRRVNISPVTHVAYEILGGDDLDLPFIPVSDITANNYEVAKALGMGRVNPTTDDIIVYDPLHPNPGKITSHGGVLSALAVHIGIRDSEYKTENSNKIYQAVDDLVDAIRNNRGSLVRSLIEGGLNSLSLSTADANLTFLPLGRYESKHGTLSNFVNLQPSSEGLAGRIVVKGVSGEVKVHVKHGFVGYKRLSTYTLPPGDSILPIFYKAPPDAGMKYNVVVYIGGDPLTFSVSTEPKNIKNIVSYASTDGIKPPSLNAGDYLDAGVDPTSLRNVILSDASHYIATADAADVASALSVESVLDVIRYAQKKGKVVGKNIPTLDDYQSLNVYPKANIYPYVLPVDMVNSIILKTPANNLTKNKLRDIIYSVNRLEGAILQQESSFLGALTASDLDALGLNPKISDVNLGYFVPRLRLVPRPGITDIDSLQKAYNDFIDGLINISKYAESNTATHNATNKGLLQKDYTNLGIKTQAPIFNSFLDNYYIDGARTSTPGKVFAIADSIRDLLNATKNATSDDLKRLGIAPSIVAITSDELSLFNSIINSLPIKDKNTYNKIKEIYKISLNIISMATPPLHAGGVSVEGWHKVRIKPAVIKVHIPYLEKLIRKANSPSLYNTKPKLDLAYSKLLIAANKIIDAAELNSADKLIVADFEDAQVDNMTTALLPKVATYLNNDPIDGNAIKTLDKLQGLIDGVIMIQNGEPLSIQNISNLAIGGIDSSDKQSLFNSAINRLNANETLKNTYDKVVKIANTVANIVAIANGDIEPEDANATGADFAQLQINPPVDALNRDAFLYALKAYDPQDVNTMKKLDDISKAMNDRMLTIAQAATANISLVTLSLNDYSLAGIVNMKYLALVNSFLDGDINETHIPKQKPLQDIVNIINTIPTNNNTINKRNVKLLRFIPISDTSQDGANLFSDILNDYQSQRSKDRYDKINTIFQVVAKIHNIVSGSLLPRDSSGKYALSVNELNLLELDTPITNDFVGSFLYRLSSGVGSDFDTKVELEALISDIQQSLDIIKVVAERNTATFSFPAVPIYQKAGIDLVGIAPAHMESYLNNAFIQGNQTDTPLKVQTIVDHISNIIDNNKNITADAIDKLGFSALSGINRAEKLKLINDVLNTFNDVRYKDTYQKVGKIITQVEPLFQVASGDSKPEDARLSFNATSLDYFHFNDAIVEPNILAFLHRVKNAGLANVQTMAELNNLSTNLTTIDLDLVKLSAGRNSGNIEPRLLEDIFYTSAGILNPKANLLSTYLFSPLIDKASVDDWSKIKTSADAIYLMINNQTNITDSDMSVAGIEPLDTDNKISLFNTVLNDGGDDIQRANYTYDVVKAIRDSVDKVQNLANGANLTNTTTLTADDLNKLMLDRTVTPENMPSMIILIAHKGADGTNTWAKLNDIHNFLLISLDKFVKAANLNDADRRLVLEDYEHVGNFNITLKTVDFVNDYLNSDFIIGDYVNNSQGIFDYVHYARIVQSTQAPYIAESLSENVIHNKFGFDKPPAHFAFANDTTYEMLLFNSFLDELSEPNKDTYNKLQNIFNINTKLHTIARFFVFDSNLDGLNVSSLDDIGITPTIIQENLRGYGFVIYKHGYVSIPHYDNLTKFAKLQFDALAKVVAAKRANNGSPVVLDDYKDIGIEESDNWPREIIANATSSYLYNTNLDVSSVENADALQAVVDQIFILDNISQSIDEVGLDVLALPFVKGDSLALFNSIVNDDKDDNRSFYQDSKVRLEFIQVATSLVDSVAANLSYKDDLSGFAGVIDYDIINVLDLNPPIEHNNTNAFILMIDNTYPMSKLNNKLALNNMSKTIANVLDAIQKRADGASGIARSNITEENLSSVYIGPKNPNIAKSFDSYLVDTVGTLPNINNCIEKSDVPNLDTVQDLYTIVAKIYEGRVMPSNSELASLGIVAQFPSSYSTYAQHLFEDVIFTQKATVKDTCQKVSNIMESSIKFTKFSLGDTNINTSNISAKDFANLGIPRVIDSIVVPMLQFMSTQLSSLNAIQRGEKYDTVAELQEVVDIFFGKIFLDSDWDTGYSSQDNVTKLVYVNMTTSKMPRYLHFKVGVNGLSSDPQNEHLSEVGSTVISPIHFAGIRLYEGANNMSLFFGRPDGTFIDTGKLGTFYLDTIKPNITISTISGDNYINQYEVSNVVINGTTSGAVDKVFNNGSFYKGVFNSNVTAKGLYDYSLIIGIDQNNENWSYTITDLLNKVVNDNNKTRNFTIEFNVTDLAGNTRSVFKNVTIDVTAKIHANNITGLNTSIPNGINKVDVTSGPILISGDTTDVESSQNLTVDFIYQDGTLVFSKNVSLQSDGTWFTYIDFNDTAFTQDGVYTAKFTILDVAKNIATYQMDITKDTLAQINITSISVDNIVTIVDAKRATLRGVTDFIDFGATFDVFIDSDSGNPPIRLTNNAISDANPVDNANTNGKWQMDIDITSLINNNSVSVNLTTINVSIKDSFNNPATFAITALYDPHFPSVVVNPADPTALLYINNEGKANYNITGYVENIPVERNGTAVNLLVTQKGVTKTISQSAVLYSVSVNTTTNQYGSGNIEFSNLDLSAFRDYTSVNAYVVFNVSLTTRGGVYTSDAQKAIKDTIAPTVNITVNDLYLSIDDNLSNINFAFSEPIKLLKNATTPNAAVANWSSVPNTNSLNYTAQVIANSFAKQEIPNNTIMFDTSSLVDIAGNPLSQNAFSNNFIIDTVRPNATINVAPIDLRAGNLITDPNMVGEVNYTFTEAVNLSIDNVTLPNGLRITPQNALRLITPDMKQWTGNIYTKNDTFRQAVNISLNANNWTDLAGNKPHATISYDYSNAFYINTKRPEVKIVIQNDTNGNEQTFIGTHENVTIYFQFTQAPITDISLGADKAFTLSDIDVSHANGTVHDLRLVQSNVGPYNGSVYAVTFATTQYIYQRVNNITLSKDTWVGWTLNRAANSSTSVNFEIDSIPPYVNITYVDEVEDSALLKQYGDGAGQYLTVGEVGYVNFSFNKEPIGFNIASDVEFDDNLTWVPIDITTNPKNLQYKIIPKPNTYALSRQLFVDNTSWYAIHKQYPDNGSYSGNFSIDTVAPHLNITMEYDLLNLDNHTNATVTFSFNKRIGLSNDASNFTQSDIILDNNVTIVPNTFKRVINSTYTGVEWDRDAYSVVIMANNNTEDLYSSVKVANTSWADLSTNTNDTAESSSVNYVVDTVRPNVTITLSRSVLSLAQYDTNKGVITVESTEGLIGFDIEQALHIDNITLDANSVKTPKPNTYQVNFTAINGIEDLYNKIYINTSSILDTRYNYMQDTAYSYNYEIDTILPTFDAVIVDNKTLKYGENTTVYFIFRENVTNFDESNVRTINGDVVGVQTVNGNQYYHNWTATFVPNTNITNDTSVTFMIDNSATSTILDQFNNTLIPNNITMSGMWIDTLRPVLNITLAPDVIGYRKFADVNFTFSEAVKDFDANDVWFDLSHENDSWLGGADWRDVNSSLYTTKFRSADELLVRGNISVLLNSTWTDLIGNTPVFKSVSNNYVIDSAFPKVVNITLDELVLNVTNNATQIKIQFNKPYVIGLDLAYANGDINVSGGLLSNISFIGGAVPTPYSPFNQPAPSYNWTATFTAFDLLPNASYIDINLSTSSTIKDQSNNEFLKTQTFRLPIWIDTLPPELNVSINDTVIIKGQEALLTFTFNEEPKDFDITDITTAFNTQFGSFSPLVKSTTNPFVYTTIYTPNADIETKNHIMTFDKALWSDLILNEALVNSSVTIPVIDTKKPKLLNASLEKTYLKVQANNNAPQVSKLYLTFSESVNNITDANIYSNNGIIDNIVVNATNSSLWVANFTPYMNISFDTSIDVIINNTNDIEDDYQNPLELNQNITLAPVSVDTLLPRVINISLTPSTDNKIIYHENETFIITFSENVTGLKVGDISAINGSVVLVTSSSSMTDTWEIVYTPIDDIDYMSNVPFTIQSSNDILDMRNNTFRDTFYKNVSIEVDTLRPTLTLNVTRDALTVDNISTNITLLFSDNIDVNTLSVSDFDFNQSVGAFTTPMTLLVANNTFWAEFSAFLNIESNVNILNITANKWLDKLGNAPFVNSSTPSIVIDTLRPSVTDVSVERNLIIFGENTSFNVTFSENVSNVNASDFFTPFGKVSNVVAITPRLYSAVWTPQDNISLLTTLNITILSNGSIVDRYQNRYIDNSSWVINAITIDTLKPKIDELYFVTPTNTTLYNTSNMNLLLAGTQATIKMTLSEPSMLNTINITHGKYTLISPATLSTLSDTWEWTYVPYENISFESFTTFDLASLRDPRNNTMIEQARNVSIIIDTLRPTLDIDISSLFILGENATSDVAFSFNENVSKFDIFATNGDDVKII